MHFYSVSASTVETSSRLLSNKSRTNRPCVIVSFAKLFKICTKSEKVISLLP